MLTAVLFLEQVLCVHSFRQLEGRSKFLPKSFGFLLFSAQNNSYTKNTLWGGKFYSPTQLMLDEPPIRKSTQVCFNNFYSNLFFIEAFIFRIYLLVNDVLFKFKGIKICSILWYL